MAPGQRVFVHGAAMTPNILINALAERSHELHNVELVHIHTEGDAPYARAPHSKAFKANACFVGANLREAVGSGNADYIPVFLSEIPRLFRCGVLPVDVAFLQLSPPDRHGYCSLGASVDIALAALQTAKSIVAEINPQVPRSHGDGFVHIDRISAFVATDRPLYQAKRKELSAAEVQIGKLVASLIDDGATLQMGIGAVPDAVLAQLKGHRRLGIHTEMFSDGLVELVESGAVTGEEKKVCRGKIVSAFAVGSQKTYSFLDDNPMIEMKESSFTNDTAIIRKNPKVTAVNSAIEVDLTGQVCADTIGTRQFSGVGGQMDFIRGASLAEGGKPVIALNSATARGESKIVPFLKQGVGVTTTRAHVHYVVTEYGIAYLYGKNLRERARALISIAHPDHREALEIAAFARFGTV